MEIKEKVSFNVVSRYFYNGSKYDVDGAISNVIYGKNLENKGFPDIWIYIEPLPFMAKKDNERDFQILFKLTNKKNYDKEKIEKINKYPPVIDGKINGNEIKEIQAFQCPCVYEPKDSIKKYKCEHNVYIYFKDGSNLMYWGGGPEISVDELKLKGYIPYIKQYRPKSKKKFQKQLERCELTKLIGQENTSIFK